MKCQDCPKCLSLGNTKESGHALCSAMDSYFPVIVENECIFAPKPYTCNDCDRLGNDTACMTCTAEDSAYHRGNLCAGFIDKHEEAVKAAVFDWVQRGYNVEEKLNEIVAETKQQIKNLYL